ncbi:uncharacterized protein LOC141854499 [Brevipalpus obovatus]|uniref:uncharacterized protein LOC141854499 n=1 Tax=Brevipalpus obovatus TaxID=246614 RepID=UPI003D9EEAA0
MDRSSHFGCEKMSIQFSTSTKSNERKDTADYLSSTSVQNERIPKQYRTAETVSPVPVEKQKPFRPLKRKRYNIITKTRLVEEMFQSGCSISEWSRRSKIPKRNLRRWRDTYLSTMSALSIFRNDQGSEELSFLNNVYNQTTLMRRLSRQPTVTQCARRTADAVDMSHDPSSGASKIFIDLSADSPIHPDTSLINGGMVIRYQHAGCERTEMNSYHADCNTDQSYNVFRTLDEREEIRNDNVWTDIGGFPPIFPYYKSDYFGIKSEELFSTNFTGKSAAKIESSTPFNQKNSKLGFSKIRGENNVSSTKNYRNLSLDVTLPDSSNQGSNYEMIPNIEPRTNRVLSSSSLNANSVEGFSFNHYFLP